MAMISFIFKRSRYIYRIATTAAKRRFSSSIPTRHGIVKPNRSLHLTCGGTIPAEAMAIAYATWGHKSKPTILIAPSMSNSCWVTGHPGLPTDTKFHGGLWWENLVGDGDEFAIDINQYHVVSFTPLGSPFGSTSPLTTNPDTRQMYGSKFPVITPRDQAKFIRMGLDALGLGIDEKLYAVIGGSMGGLQALEYAAQYVDTYERLIAIASTGWTSPSTVALRSIQRKIVRLDPQYDPTSGSALKASEMSSILQGLLITRMIGTICYRSRTEFDDRFDWNLKHYNDGDRFEVENYLEYQGNKFAGYYDANCYLTLSYNMDRMNLGFGYDSYADGVNRIPVDKEIMLLAYDTDYLIPATEMQHLSAILGSRPNSKVYYETMHSKYGHDTFLIPNEMKQLDYRIRPFLESGVTEVERVVQQELH